MLYVLFMFRTFEYNRMTFYFKLLIIIPMIIVLL